MRDHRYSVQRVRTIRRPAITTESYRYATWFLQQVKTIFSIYPPSRIYNMDETNVGQMSDHVLTIGKANKPGRRVAVDYDKKTLLSACFTIAASGKVLSPMYIKKGKTERCLQGLAINPRYEVGKTLTHFT